MRLILIGTAALALSAGSVAAQEAETVYMGIDLTAEPQPLPRSPADIGPEQRAVGIHLRALLDEGVELGCLAFDPPASFSQTGSESEECREYLPRLVAATSDEVEIVPEPERRENRWANVPVVTLAQAAQSGNKRAQLELGIRFEEGSRGVEQNWDNALALYTLAARHTPARQGLIVSGSAETAGQGGGLSRGEISRRVPGLRDARRRLEALSERMQGQARE
ncbi:hypothetical protein [Aurantiacibacter sp. D1-12]|uniref:hypothetical protein n=1 Tax=Aurantiacibacter sp. D1-12 TaxID=2993658 RepID=UPI00237CDBDF|nr:hypothetical protein [Aurantiacibacter sp. D1-12]MDE1467067.1 hypothetical protein [Aurantiacibacter sp. D1-12]